MHITLETDYAIRIVDCLARQTQRMGAQAVADQCNVTLRFALKILRKLVGTGILRSYKGVQGGYEIAKDPADITLYDVIETIEGPYYLNRCLQNDHVCTRTSKALCPYHEVFLDISNKVQVQLKSITIEQMIQHSAELAEKMAEKKDFA